MSRILQLLTLFALSIVTVSAPSKRCCAESGFPRLEFLDDFGKIGRPNAQRNPFEERIETERHDFTQSTRTVGRGVVQIESGYSFFYNDNRTEIEKSHTGPETLLRLGLTEDIEFRLRYTYGWVFIDEAEDKQGSQDLIWSFKLGMTEECGYVPESALELRFTAPTGGSDFSTGRVDHGLDYIFGWELAEGWDLYGSAGYLTGGLDDIGLVPEQPADDWFVVWSQSVALGTELTELATVYNEFYGLFSHSREDDFSIVIYNIGIDYYLSDNFVLDFRIGKGLTPDSDDFFSGIGGGVRF